MHAAFALDRLDHDADGVLVTGRLEGFKVVERSIGEAVGHRAETDLTGVVRLTGRRHGAEGAAVEGFTGGDDMILVRAVLLDAVLTCHLDHGLIGFGAGVLVEDLVHADGLADLFGEQHLRHGVRIVEGLHQGGGLVLHRLDDLFIAVADGVDGDARVEVEIRGVVLVIHIDALGVVCKEIETLVGFDHIGVDLALDVFECQSGVLQPHDATLLVSCDERS